MYQPGNLEHSQPSSGAVFFIPPGPAKTPGVILYPGLSKHPLPAKGLLPLEETGRQHTPRSCPWQRLLHARIGTAPTGWRLNATRKRSTPPRPCAASAASLWISATSFRIRFRRASTTSFRWPRAATPATSPTCSWRISGATGRRATSCLRLWSSRRSRMQMPPWPCPQRRRDTHAGTGGIPLPGGPLTFPDRTVNIFS